MRIESLLMENKDQTVAFVDDVGEWTHEQIIKRVNKLKTELLMNGLEEGDRVAVLCENSVSFIIAIMSGLTVNATVVPLDPQLPPNELIKQVNLVGAKIICTSGKRPERIIEDENIRRGIKGVSILDEASGHWEGGHYSYEAENTIPKNQEVPAFILFTSGTSGNPKGVTLSHEAVYKNVESICKHLMPSRDDKFLITKTLVHSSTLLCELLVALKAKAKVYVLNPVVPVSVTLKRIKEFKPTIIGLNPTLLWLLNRSMGDYQSSSVKLLVLSGAVATFDLLEESEKKWPNTTIINAYGLTEAGPRVTMQKLNHSRKKGSVGYPISNVQIRIVKNGVDCQVNETGSIEVMTESIMNGYWNDEDSTKHKIHEGWIKTGDVGYLDEDLELFVIGRMDDMIIRGSHNIDPNYVESVIRNFEGIKECIVFGIVDKVNSNKIICYIIPELHYDLDILKVFEHCAKMLAPYECPQEILIKDNIPKTLNGKVSRKIAAKQHEETKIVSQ